MTRPLPLSAPVDETRLPEGQAQWVADLIASQAAAIRELSSEERLLYAHIWKHIAHHAKPPAARQFGHISPKTRRLQQAINRLKERHLIWFDEALQAVLQCPPFSALNTTHQVKAFGWERTFATSFVELPCTLAVYGPNVWLEARSICPRSGETLAYRARMREDHTLQVEALAADRWRIWVPLPAATNPQPLLEFNQIRPRIHAFYTLDDLATYRQYDPTGVAGVIYTFDQAIYLGEYLLQAYILVMERH